MHPAPPEPPRARVRPEGPKVTLFVTHLGVTGPTRRGSSETIDQNPKPQLGPPEKFPIAHRGPNDSKNRFFQKVTPGLRLWDPWGKGYSHKNHQGKFFVKIPRNRLGLTSFQTLNAFFSRSGPTTAPHLLVGGASCRGASLAQSETCAIPSPREVMATIVDLMITVHGFNTHQPHLMP